MGPRNGLESSVPVKILTFLGPGMLFGFLGPRNGVPVRSGLLSPLHLSATIEVGADGNDVPQHVRFLGRFSLFYGRVRGS